ncbi:ABC transporter substrate-binding protein [Amycolatopsis sp. NPDC051371]|uniref:ABC transporter substrate-binding protein n=1 Tax=Amycolatopsis sp. NPDC051371 TaxID=3155800 RepID=UPI003427AE00
MAAAVAAALALGSAGCGGGGAATGSNGLEKVVFGLAPVAPAGAFQVGIDQGFFKAEGIELELKVVQGGAAVLPGVMSGNPMFATSNAITLLTARDQGIPVKIVSNASADRVPPAKGLYGVVARQGSAIRTTADLKGKTVAINTLRGLGEFTVGEAVKKAGGAPGDVHYVELPFPDMAAALKKGNVDAVWVPEPFLTSLTTDGTGQLAGYTTQESVPGLASYVFTSERTDADVVARMTRALKKTLDYAEGHTDKVQAAATVLSGIPLATLQKSGMESFGTDLHTDTLSAVGNLMQQRGWIKDGAGAVKGLLP